MLRREPFGKSLRARRRRKVAGCGDELGELRHQILERADLRDRGCCARQRQRRDEV